MKSGGCEVFIVDSDSILQEESPDGAVKLPFGTEYKVRLRNTTSKKVVATIYIDRENVSGGGFVVNAGAVWDIERSVDKEIPLVLH